MSKHFPLYLLLLSPLFFHSFLRKKTTSTNLFPLISTRIRNILKTVNSASSAGHLENKHSYRPVTSPQLVKCTSSSRERMKETHAMTQTKRQSSRVHTAHACNTKGARKYKNKDSEPSFWVRERDGAAAGAEYKHD